MKATFAYDLLCTACGKVMDIERYEHRRFCVVCKTKGCIDFNRRYALPVIELTELRKVAVTTQRDVLFHAASKRKEEGR